VDSESEPHEVVVSHLRFTTPTTKTCRRGPREKVAKIDGIRKKASAKIE